MSLNRKKILILGPSGSGKDYLIKNLSKKGLKPCLKWTTRPIRDFEKQDIDYKFVSEDTFLAKIDSEEFLSWEKFIVTPQKSEPTTWYYGITNEDFNDSDIFILTPNELKNFIKRKKTNCFVIYLNIDRQIREKRLTQRQDNNDSINRRLDADEKDFKEFFDCDLCITNPDFDSEFIYSIINRN